MRHLNKILYAFVILATFTTLYSCNRDTKFDSKEDMESQYRQFTGIGCFEIGKITYHDVISILGHTPHSSSFNSWDIIDGWKGQQYLDSADNKNWKRISVDNYTLKEDLSVTINLDFYKNVLSMVEIGCNNRNDVADIYDYFTDKIGYGIKYEHKNGFNKFINEYVGRDMAHLYLNKKTTTLIVKNENSIRILIFNKEKANSLLSYIGSRSNVVCKV